MRYNSDFIDFLLQDERFIRHESDRRDIDTKQKIASEIYADTTALSRWKNFQPGLENFTRLYELGKDYFHKLPLWIEDDGSEIFYDVPKIDFGRPVFLDKGYINRVADVKQVNKKRLSDIIGEDLELEDVPSISTLGKVYLFSKVPIFLPMWPEYYVVQPEPVKDPRRIVIGSSYELSYELDIMRHVAPRLVVVARWRADPRNEEVGYASLYQHITRNEAGDYVKDIGVIRAQIEFLRPKSSD